MTKRKIRSSIVFALCSCLFALGSVYGWGGVGHRLVNEGAIYHLPPELKSFYLAHKQIIVKEAVTPDIWKERDASERFRHYIDLDYYGNYPFPLFPADREDVIKKYGREKVKKWGTLPWRIEEFFEELILAFRKKDTKEIVEISAWLGHYVADGHVPLHTTKNFDGQLTDQHGIHKRFEGKMVKMFKNRFVVHSSSPAAEVENVLEFVFSFLKEGYLDIDKILKADLIAKQHGNTKSQSYFTALYQETGEIAKKRISKASHSLASLWYTAWLRAGKPELSSFVSPPSPLERGVSQRWGVLKRRE